MPTQKDKELPGGPGYAIDVRKPAGEVAKYDYAASAGAGFENTGTEDFTVPFIAKAHYICPQVDKQDAKYITGCEPGDIFNTVTNELFKKPLVIVPVATGHNFGEWVPKKQPGSNDPRDGGFCGIHELDSPIVKRAREDAIKKHGNRAGFMKLKTPDAGSDGRYDNDLVETFYLFFVGLREDASVFKAGVRFASTQIKVYKNQIMTCAQEQRFKGPDGRLLGMPLFAHRFDLGTRPDQNKQGKFFSWRASWSGGNAAAARLEPWRQISAGKFVDPNDQTLWDDLYAVAHDFHKALQAGKARVDYEAAAQAEGATAQADDPAGGGRQHDGGDEEAPY